MPAPAPAERRFAHIDTLRALAALMVACAHVWDASLRVARPAADPGAVTWPRYFELGITGVVVFFAISGFVIYGTLRGPREGAGRRFVISRFFRLFPAYWVSMLAGLVFIWWWQGLAVSGQMVAANATMLPAVFHQPQIMGLYWTLETELVFYVVCWLVWRGGWLENERVLAGLVVGMTLAWFAVKGLKDVGMLPGDTAGSWKNLPRHLGIMFWGAYFRIVYDGTAGFRQSLRHNPKVRLLVVLTLVVVAAGGPRQLRFFIQPGRTWLSPYFVGPLLFCAWVAWLRVRNPMLAWLGKISFSIYLFHLVVAHPGVILDCPGRGRRVARVAGGGLRVAHPPRDGGGQRGGLSSGRATGDPTGQTPGRTTRHRRRGAGRAVNVRAASLRDGRRACLPGR